MFNQLLIMISHNLQLLMYIEQVEREELVNKGRPQLFTLAIVLKVSGCLVPEWLFQLPIAKMQLKKKRELFPVKRENIEDQ
ncbi:unnamed protein product (macronuclear) [Paramecium tetraurelia]|uniref:Uncharacterized protein n=1 Tax=Paramecium tetraurelia TaxID=5888 RepID=A0D3B4_PARTE|nr:uncharacterized protein GSPATT00013016001 [Paramecium tetraurelia]CAK77531.1 unnamed protein product [Paramecium tetraurelia]|eukprot:XP_001444928.1 hypothetical protein (macronuclear) [Paramecium tetraurelia strain d4-2]